MIEFSKIIREIDNELQPQWQLGAFRWADEKMDNLFTKAVNRFESAIVACEARYDWVSLQKEADFYKSEILRALKAFKEFKKIDEQTDFFKSLEVV